MLILKVCKFKQLLNFFFNLEVLRESEEQTSIINLDSDSDGNPPSFFAEHLVNNFFSL